MQVERVNDWHEKQMLGRKEYATVNEYTKAIWNVEQQYLERFRQGRTVNIGAGTFPEKSDLDCDPLIRRDLMCVGEYLPFTSGSFDTAVIFSVLDHVLDDEAVLLEAKRVTKTGGRVLVMQSVFGLKDKIFTVHERLKGRKDPNHLRHYWFDFSIQRLFKRAGLTRVNKQVQFFGGNRVVFFTLTRKG